MASKWVKRIMTVAAMGVLLQTVAKPVAGSPVYTEKATLSVTGPATSTDTEMLAAVTPIAVEMVDNAIDTLSDGLAGMDEPERMLFQRYFDPGNTGELDEQFAQEVLHNYIDIRSRFESPIEVEVKAESRMCIGRRLYYTDMFKVYVCPAFRGDESDTRRARDLIHEVTHIALKTLDRPYYAPNSRDYAELTPWGSPLSQLPVVGPVISQVTRNDTRYHPDAYAWFASSVEPLQAGMDISIK